MGNDKNVPKLRFPGFTDAWEQRKLSEILNERHVLSKITPEYPRLSFTIEEGVIDPEDRKTNKRDFLMKDEANKKFLLTEMDDIIYNPANVVFGAIHRNSYGKGCLSPIYRIFETTQNSRYLECVVRSDFFISKLAQKTEGSVVKLKTLKPEAFLEMTVCISPISEEQAAIAGFFDSLDKVITLHQRKCDEVKKLKKSMLQKMFPKDGEQFPEIRFPEFTDAWEQRKLDEVMSVVTDYVAAGSFADIKNNVTYISEPAFAQLVRTVDLKKKFTNNDFVYVDQNAFDYLWRVNLNEECIILPNIGANIGEVYYVEPSDLPYDNNVLGPNAILLKTENDTYFVFTSLSTDDFQSKLFENVGSSGQPKFNKTDLKSIQVTIPSLQEQEKIGKYFKNLDNLIALHQRRLNEIKSLKKALLQKMFV